MDWAEIGKWILALVAMLTAVGIVVKIVFVRKSTKATHTVTQTNNKAGRDVVGGNVVDNSKR